MVPTFGYVGDIISYGVFFDALESASYPAGLAEQFLKCGGCGCSRLFNWGEGLALKSKGQS